MPTFSRASQLKLASCHADLQTVCRELIKQYDFTVLEGYRDEQTQNKAFAQGTSRLCYPHSAHNKQPSLAVDIAPYPLDWDDIGRFREMLIRFDAL
ncbi:MAG: hypothetical protein MJ053_03780, partial [Elusimicrobiaceae bacterium]|nr:hypothetical protein [Elusimicrobiaceae bacterium]